MLKPMIRFGLVTSLIATLAVSSAAIPAAQTKRPDAPQLAPYVPTPQDVVERMLALANVQKTDFVVDLGCGDGRIPVTAAKKYGARGLGVDIDPRALVSSLPVGSQQLVEIAKAMSRSPSILILDEPTASLSQTEIDLLFGVLSKLRDQGVSIVYISHHLQEVLRVCDTITVLRDGRVQLTGPARDLSLERLVTAITGTSLRRPARWRSRAAGSSTFIA